MLLRLLLGEPKYDSGLLKLIISSFPETDWKLKGRVKDYQLGHYFTAFGTFVNFSSARISITDRALFGRKQ